MMAGSIIYCCLLMLVYTVPFTNSQQVAYVAFNTQWCTTLGVNEGSTFSICAYIVFINGSQSLPIDVSVHFRGINGSAKSGIDFIYTSIDRTFPAGSVPILNTSCVMIQTIGDMIVGATKTFTVSLSTNNSQVTIGDRGIGASVAVNIYNIDVTTVVMNASTVYVNENVATVPICVVLTTGIASTTISITMATTSGTAMAPSDYTTFSGTVTIPANSIGICTSIAIVDDILVEGGTSNFTVKITGSALVTVPANRSTTVITIIDIDVVTFGFWANNPSAVLEGSTAVQICVQIMNNVIMGIPVTVELRVIGVTAKNGTDFISPSAINITFWNGAVMGNLNCTSIIILQDSILEDNEDIFLSLNSYYRYVNISKTSANKTLTIIEDTDSVTLGFSNNIFMTNEGTGAPCLICIQLLAGALEKSIHSYVTTGILGTAQPYVDYIPLNLADIAFTSGASAKLNSTICINFTVIDDHVVENNETVPLSLSSTSPVSTLQTSSTATVIIYDQMDYVQIGVTSSEFVTEGVNLTATICAVILDGILGRNVVVLVNLMSFTANPGIDYEANSASFIFTNGQQTGDNQCFSVAIYHNVIVEDTEFFSANLTSLDPDVIISQGHGSTIITIYDDPDDKITFGMRSSLLYFKETDVSMPICVVLLSGQLDKNLPVGIVSTDVTAFAYRDFKPVNTTIIFNSSVAQGQSLCTDIYFIDDDVVEYSDEYFNLTLIPIDTVHTVIQIPQAIVHIEEETNDVVSIGVSYTKYNVYESLLAIVCAVILNGAVERPVSVFASSTSITAVENIDYQGVRSYELIFPPGSSENSTVCLNISTFNDTIIQPDRTFSIGLQKFDPSVLLSGSVSTVVTIKQNPIDRIVLRMQDATLIVTEGINTSVAVCVLLEATSGNLRRTVLGMLTPINSTAKEIQDYVIPTNIVSFPALSVVGSPTSCISINIINDHLVGYTDFLQLLLLSTDPVVQVHSNFAVTTITIYEDPNDYIEVGMESVHLNIPEESSTVLVCVLITAGTLEDRVNVTLKTYPITAIDGKDYIGGEFILSFSSGQSMSGNNSQCIDFLIINDHLLENDESFLITLNTTREDASIVKVSSTHTELLLTILEIPPSDSVQIGMKPLYYQVVEGEQPFVTICAVLYDGELGRDLTVNLSIVNSSLGETALFGLNYLLQSQTLTFAYNELDSTSSTPCTNVTILDNNILENESYITIGLSVASEDRLVVETAPGMNQTIIAILDDDHDIVIGFDEPMLQVTEGINMSIFVCGFVRSQTGIWKMNLSAAIIQTDGAAKDMEDYIIPNYKITFWSWRTPGSTRWCVTVLIIDDDIVENSEQLTLKLVSTNPLVTGALNSSLITVNITEDPTDYVEIEMQYSFLSVIESNSTATVCAVITSGVLEKSVAVNMVTHPTTAIEGRDYIGGVFTLVFTPGQSSNGNNLQCIDLIIIDDHEFEFDERLSITLNSTPEFASVVRISPTKRELLLLILEIPTTDTIQIGMEKTFYQEVEGETPFVTICALLYQGALARDLTVMLMVLNSTVGDTAIPGHDYILGSQNITFMYDESSNISSTPCANVTLLDDDIPENHLNVTIGLYVASIDSSDVLIVPGKNLTTILILDDDHGILVGFNERVVLVNEAENQFINICGYLTSLTGIWKSNLSSILVVTNSTAKDMEDYIIPNYKITFWSWRTPGSTRWCVTVQIIDDNIVEDSEELTLKLVSTNPLVTVVLKSSLITVNITEEPTDYVNIGFKQSEYIVYDWINSTLQICIWLSMGLLERNVTITVVTETAHNTTAVPSVNYLPLSENLTFSPNGTTVLCINLTILVDHNSAEKTLTLFISTEDEAVHVTINRTVVKIESQPQSPAPLTPRTAVIAITIWLLLLLLCCLMCLIFCLFWRKKQKKRKKVVQEGVLYSNHDSACMHQTDQNNGVEQISVHVIKKNKVGIELLRIHKIQDGASLNEHPSVHQRKGCTAFNMDGIELLSIHERKKTTALNKDGMELLPILNRKPSSNGVTVKQGVVELLPIHKTKGNTSSNKAIVNKGRIELLPIHERTGDISLNKNILDRNDHTVVQDEVKLLSIHESKACTPLNKDGVNSKGGTILQHDKMELLTIRNSKGEASSKIHATETNGTVLQHGLELLPIHERKGYPPLVNGGMNRKGGATSQINKMELLPIHSSKGDTSSNMGEIKTNVIVLQKELLPIQERKGETLLIKDDNDRKKVDLSNRDGMELLPISEMRNDTSSINAIGSTPQKEDDSKRKPSTKKIIIKMAPLSEIHQVTLPDKNMTERNEDTKLQMDGIVATHEKNGGKFLKMDKTEYKEDQSLMNVLLMKEQNVETSRTKECTEGEGSMSIKNDRIQLDHKKGSSNGDVTDRKGGATLQTEGMDLLSTHKRKGNSPLNNDGMKLQFTDAKGECPPLNKGRVERKGGVSSKEEQPNNKDTSKNKRGFNNRKHEPTLLSPHERKSCTLLNTDSIPIHQRKGCTSMNDGKISQPFDPRGPSFYEDRNELLSIHAKNEHTPSGNNAVKIYMPADGTKLSEDALATKDRIDLIPIRGRKGNNSLNDCGLVTVAAQESKPLQIEIGPFSDLANITDSENDHTKAHSLDKIPQSISKLHANGIWKEMPLIEDDWKHAIEQNSIQPVNKHNKNHNPTDKVQPATNKSERDTKDSWVVEPSIGIDNEFKAVWTKKPTRQEAWL